MARLSFPVLNAGQKALAVSPLLLALVPVQALAQEGSILPTLYYSVSALPVAAGETGVKPVVLTADDIAQSPQRSLPLVLAQQAGVSASQRGPVGSSAELRLRGLGGGYIGARLDGIDITDPTGIHVGLNFGQITSFGIDNVEILRGSQSAVHGSEAIGGVVALSTFRPQTQGLSGASRVEIGSHETVASSVALGYLDDKTEAALSLSRHLSDGFSTRASNSEADGFDGQFLSYRLTHHVTSDLLVGVNGHLRDNWAEFDATESDPLGEEAAETTGHRLFAELDLGTTRHNLSLARAEMDRASTQTHWDEPYDLRTSYFTGSRDEVLYTGQWDDSAALVLNWGLEHSREAYREDGTSHAVTNDAIFGEALWAANDLLDLSLALRLVDHETFGNHDTWRLAAAYRASDALTWRAVASTGFTAPSPYQLYSSYGQDDLLPQTSESYELGVEYVTAGGHRLQATLFDIAVQNRIGFASYSTPIGDCEDGYGCYVRIAGETRSQGLELTGSFALSEGWQLDANYTYTDARSERDGADVRVGLVPLSALNIALSGQVTADLSANIALQHVVGLEDEVYGTDGLQNVAKDDYTLVLAGLDYALSDRSRAYLQVQNLFDADYETVTGYNQAGREWRIGLDTRF